MTKRPRKKDKRKLKGPVDPYTGEVEPAAEDAFNVVEIIPIDPDNRKGENYLMEEEDSLDKYMLDADLDPDEVIDQIDDYTEDEGVVEDFAERQELASGGRQKLEERLNEHNSTNPDLSGGDIDAAWEDSSTTGEESVGGSTPTPDQDNVDELGEAAGIHYEDEEPLNSDKKILDRDRHRWELDPASADDEQTDEEQ